MPKWAKWGALVVVLILLTAKSPTFWASVGHGVAHAWENIKAMIGGL